MSRMIGTTSRGLRAPIIREGDSIVDIVGALPKFIRILLLRYAPFRL